MSNSSGDPGSIKPELTWAHSGLLYKVPGCTDGCLFLHHIRLNLLSCRSVCWRLSLWPHLVHLLPPIYCPQSLLCQTCIATNAGFSTVCCWHHSHLLGKKKPKSAQSEGKSRSQKPCRTEYCHFAGWWWFLFAKTGFWYLRLCISPHFHIDFLWVGNPSSVTCYAYFLEKNT